MCALSANWGLLYHAHSPTLSRTGAAFTALPLLSHIQGSYHNPTARSPPGPQAPRPTISQCLLHSCTDYTLSASFSHCCTATLCLLLQPLLHGYTLPALSATATRLHTACSFSHCYTATHCLLFQPLCMATHCSTVKAGSQYDATLTQRDAKRCRMRR